MFKHIIHDSEVYELWQDELFAGYRKCVPEVPRIKPYLSFLGPKIGLDEWKKVLGFLNWGYVTDKSEVQVRLYFNKEKEIWKPWAFPQEKGTGMTTREIESLEGNERQKADLGKGWIEGGSIHSHCASGAFQSSVDKENEKNKNGIHITVGKLDEYKYDIHSRVSFRGAFYEPAALSEWFVMPDGLTGLPEELRDNVMKYFLVQPIEDNQEFPIEWKENVIEVKKNVQIHGQDRDSKPWYYNRYSQPSCYDRLEDKDGRNPPEPRRLTKKEKKSLRQDLRRMIRDSGDSSKIAQDAHTQAVHRAAINTIQLCASLGMGVSELIVLSDVDPKTWKDHEEHAMEELTSILKKENVSVEDVDEWLIKIEVGAGI